MFWLWFVLCCFSLGLSVASAIQSLQAHETYKQVVGASNDLAMINSTKAVAAAKRSTIFVSISVLCMGVWFVSLIVLANMQWPKPPW